MSDLRARAREAAEKIAHNFAHSLYREQCIAAIESAILRGMVEALEAEPDEGMVNAAWAHRSAIFGDIFRAMAAARAREIKEGE